MCGICGMVNDTRYNVMHKMLDRIAHRGPDGRGHQQVGDSIIGNVRLSVIDTVGGKQPFESSCGRTVIAYNGEIYGYKKIREKLQRDGYQFKSRSDTEVILALYETHGLNFLSYLNGMFSFIIYDKKEQLYIIARDQFGIKPLLYTELNGKLYVTSEVKSLYAIPEWRAEEDRNSLHSFMNVRFTPSPHTLFKNVKKLPAGHVMIVKEISGSIPIPDNFSFCDKIYLKDKNAEIYKYYSLPNRTLKKSNREYTKSLNDLFAETMSDQLIADNAPGVYLSGGIDSSLVALFGTKVNDDALSTLCLGFNDESDENSDARLLADHLSTKHLDIILSDDPLDNYRKCVYYTEEPKVNSLQGFMLSGRAALEKKVMLSGLGGDELFGGYDVYGIARILDKTGIFSRNSAVSLSGKIFGNIFSMSNSINIDLFKRGFLLMSKNKNPLDIYILLRNGWDFDKQLRSDIYKVDLLGKSAESVSDVFKERFPKCNSLTESFMRFEFQNKMVDDFLMNEDRTSMAHGLEVRVPFLDRRIVEFAQTIPVDDHIDLFARKKILRQALKGNVPKRILKKSKQGFSFNPVRQFKKDLKLFTETYLSRDIVEDVGIFNFDFIRKVLDSNPNNSLRWHYFMLWQIMGYHIWYDIFIKKQGEL